MSASYEGKGLVREMNVPFDEEDVVFSPRSLAQEAAACI